MEIYLKGLGDFKDYHAWKFPGGELHFKLKPTSFQDSCRIYTRLNCSDDIILLCLAVDAVRKWKTDQIRVHIPYFPYQQADRLFGWGECFSLRVICNILNALPVTQYIITDPHSDVTPALLKNVTVNDNSYFIKEVMGRIDVNYWLAPDAGAFKKIFALSDKVDKSVNVISCSKFRNHETGEKTIVLPDEDWSKVGNVLIIDDICLAGGTFIQIANLLYAAGHNAKLYLAVTHGVFNGNFEELATRFTQIFTTDSRKPLNQLGYHTSMPDKLKVIPI